MNTDTSIEYAPCAACGKLTDGYNRNDEPVCDNAPFCADDYVTSILAVFDTATPAAIADGTEWYPAMHRIMREHAARSGMTARQCAAIYAATSINTPWKRNMVLAAQAIADGGLHAGTLGMVCRKVNGIIAGNDIDSTLTSDPANRKLVNFTRNLSGDYDAVTVDRWAHRVATNGNRSDVPSGKTYETIADAFRTAARMRGVSPATMQAVTWVVARGTGE